MPPSRQHRSDFTRGLTLIELVVVLMVLTAVGGILVPLFGTNVARRGSTSSSITNVAEIEKIMAMFANRHGRGHYPDHYDGLIDSSGGLYSALPGEAAGLILHRLTPAEATSLTAAGISHIWPMSVNPVHPTFDVYPSGGATPIESDVDVAVLTDPASLGLPAGATYVVFGLGAASTLFVGATDAAAMTPPVRFSGEPGGNPGVSYQRFGVVFQISDANGAALDRAHFVRAVGFGENGPFSSEQLVRQWYD